MGEFQRAGMGKNRKKHFSLEGPKRENLNNSYLLSELTNFDYDFCF
jgi:hypothetical protein